MRIWDVGPEQALALRLAPHTGSAVGLHTMPFLLVNPDKLICEGRCNGLDIRTGTQMFGHVMQFAT